jgi:hypothetical protein
LTSYNDTLWINMEFFCSVKFLAHGLNFLLPLPSTSDVSQSSCHLILYNLFIVWALLHKATNEAL